MQQLELMSVWGGGHTRGIINLKYSHDSVVEVDNAGYLQLPLSILRLRPDAQSPTQTLSSYLVKLIVSLCSSDKFDYYLTK